MMGAMREDIGKLLLRVTVAGLLLFHGVAKLRHGIGGIVASVQAHGLPAAFAYGVFFGEVIAPLFVLAGWGTRAFAAVIAFNMVVALSLSHTGQLASLGRAGGYAAELPVLYLCGAIAVALLGPGRYSVSRGKGRLA